MLACNWLCLFVILSTAVFVYGTNYSKRFKRSPILTDDVAQDNQFPYAVAIMSVQEGYRCSGGIIHERFILSAAHCFTVKGTSTFETQTYLVHAGTNDYKAYSSVRNVKVISVKKIFIPRDFDFGSRRSDIAVVELAREIVIDNHHFKKLKLPHICRKIGKGDRAVVAAFGACEVRLSSINDTHNILNKLTIDGKLRYANIEIIGTDSCRNVRPYANFPIENYHLLGQMVKKSNEVYGMCYGDSGSSLVYITKNTEGKMTNTVFGVFIDAFDKWCDGRKLPVIFTKVSSFVLFIHDAMNGNINEGMRVRDIIP